MKVIVFEVCRSPEIAKMTEAFILSKIFSQKGIDYEIYSNDGIWLSKTIIDKYFIKSCLANYDIKIAHLALHGDNSGLILKWSSTKRIKDRIPVLRLTGNDIKAIKEWNKKLIVSGACSSAKFAKYFLYAGAEAVIAPSTPIDWTNLADFFGLFYAMLFSGQKASQCLDTAIIKYPEFESFNLFS
jgi:hypothetical protein